MLPIRFDTTGAAQAYSQLVSNDRALLQYGYQIMTSDSIDQGGIENSLQIVSENLAEALDLRSNQKILDIVTGNENFTAAAASRWAFITSTDVALPALKHAESRLRAQRLEAVFELVDTANLPYLSDTFDVTASTFGLMSYLDKNLTSQELIRVTKHGGKIRLINWTPEGFMGHLHETIELYTPSMGRAKSAISLSLDWGNQTRLNSQFASASNHIQIKKNVASLKFRSPDHWLSLYNRYYAPLTTTFAALNFQTIALLTRELLELVNRYNTAKDASVTLPCEYLECIIKVAKKALR